MTDIIKRAKVFMIKNTKVVSDITRMHITYGYIHGASDQDPISRADERKKVVEKACQWLMLHDSYSKSTEQLVRELKQAIE